MGDRASLTTLSDGATRRLSGKRIPSSPIRNLRGPIANIHQRRLWVESAHGLTAVLGRPIDLGHRSPRERG